jgi:hypothetical protein
MTPSVRFSFSLSDLDFSRIQEWLASTYWSPGISLDRVIKGFTASTLVIGAFDGGTGGQGSFSFIYRFGVLVLFDSVALFSGGF